MVLTFCNGWIIHDLGQSHPIANRFAYKTSARFNISIFHSMSVASRLDIYILQIVYKLYETLRSLADGT